MRVVTVSAYAKHRFSRQNRTIEEYLATQGLRRGIDFELEYHLVMTRADLDRVIAAQPDSRFILYSNSRSTAELVFDARAKAPHVFSTYSDPLASGWIESYAHPGGNATGVVTYADAHEKRLDLLLRIKPFDRIAVLFCGPSPQRDLQHAIDRFRAAHGSLSVDVIIVTPATLASLATNLRSRGVQAAYVPVPLEGSGDLDSVAKGMFATLAELRIPAISERRSDTRLGAAMALEADWSQVNGNVARQIGLLLAGAKPGSVPVQSPRRLVLTVDMAVATRIGLAVPRSLLRQAEFTVAQGL